VIWCTFLSLLWALQLSWDILVDVGFLFNNSAVFGVVIQETSCIILIQMFIIYIQLNCTSDGETHINIMFWPRAFWVKTPLQFKYQHCRYTCCLPLQDRTWQHCAVTSHHFLQSVSNPNDFILVSVHLVKAMQVLQKYKWTTKCLHLIQTQAHP